MAAGLHAFGRVQREGDAMSGRYEDATHRCKIRWLALESERTGQAYARGGRDWPRLRDRWFRARARYEQAVRGTP